MISYEGFGKRFGAVTAVHALDLSIRSGETFALIGPNGSGKSTTLKALVGLVHPSSGRILMDGHDATRAGPEARARLGYLPQRLVFPEGWTARETMRFHARLRHADEGAIDGLLARVGLGDDADRPVEEYSGGMRQRFGLAIALLGRPAALVLDEPSAALDPSGALLIRDILEGIRAEGTTVLLSSHDLAEVAALADRIGVFVGGRMAASGTLPELEGLSGARGIEAVYRRLSSGVRPVSGADAEAA